MGGQGRLIANRGDGAGGPYDVYDTNGNVITNTLLNDTSPGTGTGVAFNGTDFYVANIAYNSVTVYNSSGTFLETITLGNPLPDTGTGERLIEGLSFNYQQTLGPPSIAEPSTWAMLMVGFAGLGYAGFRRGAKARSAIA